MRKALIVWLGLTASGSVAAQSMTPADEPLVSESSLSLPDPGTRSGWIRVEIAVLADDASSTLASETWEATPSVRYPGQWRWLTDLEEQASLLEQFPDASLEVGDRGDLTITLPPPPPPSTQSNLDTAGQVERVSAGDGIDPSIDPMTGQPSDSFPSDRVPLESLGARSEQIVATDDDDWLEPFAEDASLADAAAQMQSADDPNEAASTESQQPAPPVPPPEPPPEPIPFLARPTEMLEDGLDNLRRQRGEGAAIQAAWVQPPGAANLPIVLDRSGEDLLWPRVQGFVELRRGSEFRVGVNFWLNTMGEYLPKGFAMDPPPRAPKRIAVLEPDPEPLIGTELGVGVDLAVAPALQPRGETEATARSKGRQDAIAFIDPETGHKALGSSEDFSADGVDGDSWPYRHLITVADTRSVPENGVRYFDHPALQVVVTWRELTWGEVWSLGEADVAKRTELLAPTDPEEAAEPASVVPPEMQERY